MQLLSVSSISHMFYHVDTALKRPKKFHQIYFLSKIIKKERKKTRETQQAFYANSYA